MQVIFGGVIFHVILEDALLHGLGKASGL